MGKTYQKNSKQFEDEFTSKKRSGKQAKHATNHKGQGMKTLNSYVEEDYDDDPFEDDFEIRDEIFIQHTKS
jgi:hypothetical protein